MYQRVRRRKVAEINVVPYIDVMLVLLIIFMVTAPLITQGVKVDLPQAEAEPLDKDTKPPLVASVDAQGRYYITLGANDKEPLSAEEVATLVKAHLAVNPDRKWYLVCSGVSFETGGITPNASAVKKITFEA